MANPLTLVSPGELLDGKYRLERVIGEGGMGVVVQAMHLELGRTVAIKVMSSRDADPDFVARFLREARAMASLQNEHVVQIFDTGRLRTGEPYFVMERLEGEDLRHLLKAHGPLTVAQAVDLTLQACDGIGEAHDRGIVHRDLKPANLFLVRRRDGSHLVKVLDFGISKSMDTSLSADQTLTRTGALLGSPRYMSPEQLRDAREVDGRSDIWALGVILYEMIRGSTPYEATNLPELGVKLALSQPDRLTRHRNDVPPALDALICDRMLAKDPAQRLGSIRELVTELAPFSSMASRSSAAQSAPLVLPDAPSRPPRSRSYNGTAPSPSTSQTECNPPWSSTALATTLNRHPSAAARDAAGQRPLATAPAREISEQSHAGLSALVRTTAPDRRPTAEPTRRITALIGASIIVASVLGWYLGPLLRPISPLPLLNSVSSMASLARMSAAGPTSAHSALAPALNSLPPASAETNPRLPATSTTISLGQATDAPSATNMLLPPPRTVPTSSTRAPLPTERHPPAKIAKPAASSSSRSTASSGPVDGPTAAKPTASTAKTINLDEQL